MTAQDFTRVANVIDTDRYPLHIPDSPERRRIVADCRRMLAEQQYCELPRFMREPARERAVGDALAAIPAAHENSARRNCYLQRAPDPDRPADHPRNIFLDASMLMIAADLLPQDSPLKTLYYWEATRQMLAEIVGLDRLYVNEDPFQPINTLCYRNGDKSAWHFDSENAFTVTLMLQAPESGGAFQIWPNTRTDDDQRYDQVARVLKGQADDGIKTISRAPGDLCIFRGCNSLHRVAAVQGERPRIMGVFVYETEPGVVGDPEVNATIYGPRAKARVRAP